MDAAHIHLLLKHVPVLAVPLGGALLLWAALRRSRETLRVALALFILAGAVAIPVYLTGEPAEEAVERVAPADAYVERHEDTASFALAAAIALGVVATGGLALQQVRPAFAAHAGIAAGAVAVVAFSSLAWTASLGGQIRHTEIRAGATGANSPSGYYERDHDDHDDD
jgi:uncharacterized membrane protein (DUF4010 family)